MQDDAKMAFEAWFDWTKYGKRVLSPEGFARLVWQEAFEAGRRSAKQEPEADGSGEKTKAP